MFRVRGGACSWGFATRRGETARGFRCGRRESHRAKVSRNPPVSSGAHFHQRDCELSGRAGHGPAQVVLMLPLEAITVVSLEQAVAAPFATRQLADLGARVIKIERPEVGDFARGYDSTVRGMSSHFVWANRSKESLTLDVKQPAADEVLHRLLSKADVFIQNLAPGACDRLGLSNAELRKKYPRMIICNGSGYGST